MEATIDDWLFELGFGIVPFRLLFFFAPQIDRSQQGHVGQGGG